MSRWCQWLLVGLLTVEIVFGEETGAFTEYKHWSMQDIPPDQATGDHVVNLGSYKYECAGNVLRCSSERGLTVALWLLPSPEMRGDSVLVTSGGTDVLSSGYYLRQIDHDRYVVGVAEKYTVWQIYFSLHAGAWSHVAFTWRKSKGIELYIDGFFIESSEQGKEREYYQPQYPQFPYIRAGPTRLLDDPWSKYNMFNLSFWDRAMTPDQILDLDSRLQIYSRDCLKSLPDLGEDAERQDVPPDSQGQEMCRELCAENFKRYSVISKGEKKSECLCLDTEVLDLHGKQVACTSDSTQWKVMVATNAFKEKEMGQIIIRTKPNLISSRTKTTVQTGQIVKINVHTQSQVDPDYLSVDFGDGTKLESFDTELEHSWMKPGKHRVKIAVYYKGYSKAISFVATVIESMSGEAARIEQFTLAAVEEDETAVFIQLIGVALQPFSCHIIYEDKDGKQNSSMYANDVPVLYYSNTIKLSSAGTHDFYAYCVNGKGLNYKNASIDLKPIEFHTEQMEIVSEKGQDLKIPNNFLDYETLLS